MIELIKATAREHLAVDGPNLSLRAVARDIGVVSSAVYRYFTSRDDLLTALILDAYTDLGDAVETAEQAVPRSDFAGRWQTLGRATRNWANANPPEYALLYGSPVPGYTAPPDTVGPASRVVQRLALIMRDAHAAGELAAPPHQRLPRPLRADLTALVALPEFGGTSVAIVARGMTAWTLLFGLISFELFGRLTNGIHDYEAYFEHQWRGIAGFVGLP
jgi:AcrR family transcriptional regulator